MTDKFYTSASALEAFFACPARYQFRKKWITKSFNKDLQDGLDAHSVMAGDIPAKMSRWAHNFTKDLRTLIDMGGYDILETEEKQFVEIVDGLIIVRIIDAIALDIDAGELVLIDYKTGTWPWSQIGEEPDRVCPKAYTFQATSYLIPPDDEAEWPTEIHFLVATQKGPPIVFKYHYNQEDVSNLFEAIGHVRDNRHLSIKHRGYTCRTCEFAPLCFEIPNYEDLYERKKPR